MASRRGGCRSTKGQRAANGTRHSHFSVKARHPVFFYWVEDATAEMDSFRNDGYK